MHSAKVAINTPIHHFFHIYFVTLHIKINCACAIRYVNLKIAIMPKPSKTALILLSIAGVVVYSLLRKGGGIKNLRFFPGAIKKITWNGTMPVLEFSLGVQNTSNQSFTIKSVAGNIYANGTYIGNVGAFSPQNVAPNSQAMVTLLFRLQLTGVVNNIIDAINSGTFKQTLKMDLIVNVDNLQVPVNFDIKVG